MKLIKYIAFVFSLSILAACNENFFTPVVDINLPPHKAKLVVFANFQAESDSLVVYLSRSRSALDTTQKTITVSDTFKFGNTTSVRTYQINVGDTLKDAKVELFRNEVLWGTFKSNKLGQYILRQKILADGATYRIRAEVSGYDVVEATQKMPAVATLDSVRYVKDGAIVQDGIDTYKSNEFTYFIKDPAELGNYYAVQGVFYESRQPNNPYPQILYQQSLDKLAQSGFLNDKSFNGKAYNWRNHGRYYNEPQKGDRIEYRLFNTTSDAFLFTRSKELNENAKDNPFAEPTILYSNIKNGYGLFALSTVSTWVKRF